MNTMTATRTAKRTMAADSLRQAQGTAAAGSPSAGSPSAGSGGGEVITTTVASLEQERQGVERVRQYTEKLILTTTDERMRFIRLWVLGAAQVALKQLDAEIAALRQAQGAVCPAFVEVEGAGEMQA